MAYMGFTWQGRNSADYGLALSALPVISMPASRYSVTNIPGRNDTIFKREGFADYTVELSLVYVGEHSDFRDAMNDFFYKDALLFTKRNKLILPTENSYEYTAYLFEEIDFEKFYRYKTTTVKFTVQPLKEYVNSWTVDSETTEHSLVVPTGQYTIFGRKPRFFIECNLQNITEGRILIEIGKITTENFTRGYRYLVISRPSLRSFGEKVIVVLDFESDEYYVCKPPVSFTRELLSEHCAPENAVSSLVPLLFLDECLDVDNTSEATYPMSLWSDVTFKQNEDKINVYKSDGTTSTLINSKVCEEFRVKSL